VCVVRAFHLERPIYDPTRPDLRLLYTCADDEHCTVRAAVVFRAAQHALVVIRSLAAANLLSHFLTVVAIAAPSRHNPAYTQSYSLCRAAGNGSTELTGHLN